MDERRATERPGYVGHEERDVNVRPVALAALGLAVATMVVFGVVGWIFWYDVAREARRSPAASSLATSYGRQVPPEPRLQTKPIQDLTTLRAAEDAVLNNYGWVDRQAGTVRIPIARAMELLAQRGLPAEAETGSQP